MIAYGRGPAPGSATVSFVIEPAPEHAGGGIAVVGDFNDWDRTRHGFTPGDDGRWRVNVVLETGRRYAFRYVTDSGHWFDEPDAQDHRENGHGQRDCILDLRDPVEPPPAQPAAESDVLHLDAIRRRMQAASPGPWERHGGDVHAAGQPLLAGRDGDPSVRHQADLDAEFVAHARADVAALLAALDSVRRPAPVEPAVAVPTRFQLRAGLDGVRALLTRPGSRPTEH